VTYPNLQSNFINYYSINRDRLQVDTLLPVDLCRRTLHRLDRFTGPPAQCPDRDNRCRRRCHIESVDLVCTAGILQRSVDAGVRPAGALVAAVRIAGLAVMVLSLACVVLLLRLHWGISRVLLLAAAGGVLLSLIAS
jgi:hypothetical protein